MANDGLSYVYGIGLELDKKSIKSIKDQLKKDYKDLGAVCEAASKTMKVHPDMDLSQIYEDFSKMKQVIDTISGSNVSLDHFVDKGLLDRIVSMEKAVEKLGEAMKKVGVDGTQLNNAFNSVTNGVKVIAADKQPGHDINLRSYNEEIRYTKDSIKKLTTAKNNMQRIMDEIAMEQNETTSRAPASRSVKDRIRKWTDEFEAVVGILENGPKESEINNILKRYNTATSKLAELMSITSNEDFDKQVGMSKSSYFESFKDFDKYLGNMQNKTQAQLKDYESMRDRYKDALKDPATRGAFTNINASGTAASLGSAPFEIEAYIDEGAWIGKVNAAIKTVQNKALPVELKLQPTLFKNSKNVIKETESGNEATVSHDMNVKIEVNSNIEEYKTKLQDIKNQIDNVNKGFKDTKITLGLQDDGSLEELKQKIRGLSSTLSEGFENVQVIIDDDDVYNQIDTIIQHIQGQFDGAKFHIGLEDQLKIPENITLSAPVGGIQYTALTPDGGGIGSGAANMSNVDNVVIAAGNVDVNGGSGETSSTQGPKTNEYVPSDQRSGNRIWKEYNNAIDKVNRLQRAKKNLYDNYTNVRYSPEAKEVRRKIKHNTATDKEKAWLEELDNVGHEYNSNMGGYYKRGSKKYVEKAQEGWDKLLGARNERLNGTFIDEYESQRSESDKLVDAMLSDQAQRKLEEALQRQQALKDEYVEIDRGKQRGRKKALASNIELQAEGEKDIHRLQVLAEHPTFIDSFDHEKYGLFDMPESYQETYWDNFKAQQDQRESFLKAERDKQVEALNSQIEEQKRIINNDAELLDIPKEDIGKKLEDQKILSGTKVYDDNEMAAILTRKQELESKISKYDKELFDLSSPKKNGTGGQGINSPTLPQAYKEYFGSDVYFRQSDGKEINIEEAQRNGSNVGTLRYVKGRVTSAIKDKRRVAQDELGRIVGSLAVQGDLTPEITDAYNVAEKVNEIMTTSSKAITESGLGDVGGRLKGLGKVRTIGGLNKKVNQFADNKESNKAIISENEALEKRLQELQNDTVSLKQDRTKSEALNKFKPSDSLLTVKGVANRKVTELKDTTPITKQRTDEARAKKQEQDAQREARELSERRTQVNQMKIDAIKAETDNKARNNLFFGTKDSDKIRATIEQHKDTASPDQIKSLEKAAQDADIKRLLEVKEGLTLNSKYKAVKEQAKAEAEAQVKAASEKKVVPYEEAYKAIMDKEAVTAEKRAKSMVASRGIPYDKAYKAIMDEAKTNAETRATAMSTKNEISYDDAYKAAEKKARAKFIKENENNMINAIDPRIGNGKIISESELSSLKSERSQIQKDLKTAYGAKKVPLQTRMAEIDERFRQARIDQVKYIDDLIENPEKIQELYSAEAERQEKVKQEGQRRIEEEKKRQKKSEKDYKKQTKKEAKETSKRAAEQEEQRQAKLNSKDVQFESFDQMRETLSGLNKNHKANSKYAKGIKAQMEQGVDAAIEANEKEIKQIEAKLKSNKPEYERAKLEQKFVDTKAQIYRDQRGTSETLLENAKGDLSEDRLQAERKYNRRLRNARRRAKNDKDRAAFEEEQQDLIESGVKPDGSSLTSSVNGVVEAANNKINDTAKKVNEVSEEIKGTPEIGAPNDVTNVPLDYKSDIETNGIYSSAIPALMKENGFEDALVEQAIGFQEELKALEAKSKPSKKDKGRIANLKASLEGMKKIVDNSLSKTVEVAQEEIAEETAEIKSEIQKPTKTGKKKTKKKSKSKTPKLDTGSEEELTARSQRLENELSLLNQIKVAGKVEVGDINKYNIPANIFKQFDKTTGKFRNDTKYIDSKGNEHDIWKIQKDAKDGDRSAQGMLNNLAKSFVKNIDQMIDIVQGKIDNANKQIESKSEQPAKPKSEPSTQAPDVPQTKTDNDVSDAGAIETATQAQREYNEAKREGKELDASSSTSNTNQARTSQILDEVNAQEQLNTQISNEHKLLKTVYNIGKNSKMKSMSRTSVDEYGNRTTTRYKDGQFAGATIVKDNKVLTGFQNKVDRQQKMLSNMKFVNDNIGFDIGDSGVSKIREFEVELEKLKTIKSQLASDPSNEKLLGDFDTQLLKLKQISNEFNSMSKGYVGFVDGLSNHVEKQQSILDKMKFTSQNLGVDMGDAGLDKITAFEIELQRLKSIQEQLAQNPTDEALLGDFNNQILKMEQLSNAFNTVAKDSAGFISKISDVKNDIKSLGDDISPDDYEALNREMTDFANSAGVGSAKFLEYTKNGRGATYEIKTQTGALRTLTVEYDSGTHSIGRYVSNLGTATSASQKMLNLMGTGFRNVFRYFASFGSVYQLINVARQGVESVKEIDTALTELKKVTNETDATYSKFLQTASQTAGIIGSTVSEVTTMTAEWARLGYTIQESADLAKSTGVLLNVSEFSDATEASQALISTMQAFSDELDPSNSMRAVDVLNEIGNKYAVSSDGIATALQSSAAALHAAGNDYSQSVAMIAAANKVTQDPSKVGAALRTISLRLRGTSVEEMEEAGEDTDGLVSQSKMREKVKALAGVDILTNSGAYKDTYTIIKEIGQVWEDMSDIDQAALLELMAGKNRSNVMASLLGNMKDLNDAYSDAQNAAGSAYKENQTYLDSIQGKMDLFTNSVQTFWMNLLNSDFIKGVVDDGTTLMKILDTLPGKIAAVGVAWTAISSVKNKTSFKDIFNGLYEDITKNIKFIRNPVAEAMQGFGDNKISGKSLFNTLESNGVSNETISSIKNIDGLTERTKKLTQVQKENVASVLKSQLSNKELTASQKEVIASQYACITASLGLVDAETLAALGGEEQARETLKAAVANGKLAASDATVALAAMGLAISEEGASASEKEAAASAILTAVANGKLAMSNAYAALTADGMTRSMAAARVAGAGLLKVIKANPVLAFAAAGYAASKAFDALITTAKESYEAMSDRLDGITSAVDSATSDLNDMQSEFDEINSQISELEGKNLTFTDDQELQRLKDRRQELMRNMDAQKDLLDSQKEVQADVASETLTNFLKSSSQATQEAEKTGKVLGAVMGAGLAASILLAIPTLGASLGATGVIAAVGAAGYAGSTLGSETATKLNENDGSFEDWYKTYQTVYAKKKEAADKAKEKYQSAPGDMDLYDEWQEKQSAVTEVQSEMYDQLNQIQQYVSQMSYGISDEIDAQLDSYYNFIDKMNIDNGAANAKKNALDRLFGENASQEVKDFKDEVDKAVAEDRELEIEIPPEIAARIEDLGISTEELGDYLTHTGEIGVGAFEDLSGAISDAKTASDALNESLDAESNGGYETRDKAIEEMQRLIDKGLTGSESNVWNIAEKYGFTRKAGESIDDATKRLQKFINVRKDWYKLDDDGDITSSGAMAFAKDMQSAVNSDSKTGKAIRDAGMKWDFNSDTGDLDFSFNNMKLDEVVEQLSKTKELSGITKEEFIDMMTAIGQFAEVNWTSGNDIITWIDALAEGGATATEQLDEMKDPLQSLLSGENLESDTIKEWLSSDTWFEEIEGNETFKKLSEDIQEAIKKYKELQEVSSARTETDINEGSTDAQNAYQSLSNTATPYMDTLMTNVKIDVSDIEGDKAKIDSLNGSIDAIQEIRKLNLDDTQAQQADTILEDLISRKQELEAPTIMNVDTSTIKDDGLKEGISLLKQYQKAQNDLEKKKALGLDTDDAEKKVSGLQKKIKKLKPEVKTKLGIDKTSQTELNKSIAKLTKKKLKKLGIEVEVKDDEVQNYEADDKNSKVIFTADATKVETWRAKNHDVNAKVKYTADTSNLHVPSRGGGGLNGTAHASGTAHAHGDWGAKRTETALTGELGRELVVRGNRWFTVGDNGAEFANIKKGDIIFNHKQTEELLNNGYVTSRGKAYASGTAYGNGGGNLAGTNNSDTAVTYTSTKSKTGSKNSRNSGKKNNFSEIFDWIEVKIDEINKKIDLMGAKLKNIASLTSKKTQLDEMLKATNNEISVLKKGYNKYNNYAKNLLNKVPASYRAAAQNGAISIETFRKKGGEKTYNAIKKYREWREKALNMQLEIQNKIAERTELAVQKIDTIGSRYDAEVSLNNSRIDTYKAEADLRDEKGIVPGDAYYKATIERENENKKLYQDKYNEMSAEFQKQVKNGNLKKYSDEWYEELAKINDVQKEITDTDLRIEQAQNTMLENQKKRFQHYIDEYDRLTSEVKNLIELLGEEKLVDEDSGMFTKEGIATIGLYAQQMEVAEKRAEKYATELNDLIQNRSTLLEDGTYSLEEYNVRVAELKDGQYDSIQAYNDAKDAIVDLEKTRIDTVKNSMDKELDAYSKLIEKKKEELSAEKDLYDFQKSTMEQQKDIAKIQRKLAALSNDNSASAIAERKKLEAELAEAQANLKDSYYERSVQDQQDALDKELDDLQEAQDKKKEQLEKELEDTEAIIKDSIDRVRDYQEGVYDTLVECAENYQVELSDALTKPWEDVKNAVEGAKDAVASYTKTFNDSTSGNTKSLEGVDKKWDDAHDTQDKSAKNEVAEKDENYDANKSASRVYTKMAKITSVLKKGSTGKWVESLQHALQDLGYKLSITGYFNSTTVSKLKKFQKKMGIKQTGTLNATTKKKLTAKGYAKGTTGVKDSQLAWIDEFGEELVLRPDGKGKLSYLSKGTSVIPADLTKNLMQWGELDPQAMIDRSRPVIGASPNVVNNNLELNMNIGEVVHIDKVTNDTIPDLTKAVEKQMDTYMAKVNNSLKRYTR